MPVLLKFYDGNLVRVMRLPVTDEKVKALKAKGAPSNKDVMDVLMMLIDVFTEPPTLDVIQDKRPDLAAAFAVLNPTMVVVEEVDV